MKPSTLKRGSESRSYIEVNTACSTAFPWLVNVTADSPLGACGSSTSITMLIRSLGALSDASKFALITEKSKCLLLVML